MSDIRGSKFLLIGDIERCPYVPKQLEYTEWNRQDIERCQIIHDARKELFEKANQYLSHEDRNIRKLAMFYIWIFDKD